MMKKILNKFGYEPISQEKPAEVKHTKPRQVFSTDYKDNSRERLEKLWDHTFKNPYGNQASSAGTDKNYAMDNQLSAKQSYNGNFVIPEIQVLWYASQSFIGYQLCAMLSQNWLISKACLMPAKDATRNGYEISVNNGKEVEPEVLDAIRKQDEKYKLNQNLIEFVKMGRVFGIRIAMFVVESDDPDYYRKPFNIDGVMTGAYKGISQIDPYWITPQLDADAAGNPGAMGFYEPTWWVLNGKPIHNTHLVIFRTEELPDILKPTYIYGGVSIPQKIAERVYAAERCANEAPLLTLTKRTDVVKADMAQATADFDGFANRMQQWVYNRDNYGIKMLGLDEEMQQFDTSLSDLDAVIMTQYQLVAAASNVPATKLLGTSPKGFNATGEFEESSYHEELESIQKHDLSPLIERHHLLLIQSEIAPEFSIETFETTVTWNELDAMTGKEQSELNRFKAETGRMLIESGAIDPGEERQRVMSDPESGYHGLNMELQDEGESVLNDLTGA